MSVSDYNPLYKGVDLSVYNGNVDFEKLKAAGYDFVILRAGFGKVVPKQKDAKFEEYYKGAKKAGLYVGAYWYSYAKTVEDAVLEANACLSCIGGKEFDFPIFYDVEEKFQFDGITFTRASLTRLVNSFCTKIQDAGYMAGLYTFYSVIQNFDMKQIKFEKWLAKWSGSMGVCTTNEWATWQHGIVGFTNKATIKGSVRGIKGDVDVDVCFKDYPKIISQKTDSNKVEPVNETVTTPSQSSDNISLKKGNKISLSNVNAYISADAKTVATKKSGTFYLYDTEVINGRVRITVNSNYVGREPAYKYVTCWINVLDIPGQEKTSETTSEKEKPVENKTADSNKIVAGKMIKLDKVALYAASSVKDPSRFITGNYYIYSTTIINNRIRITNVKENVGKTPIAKFVTGWISVSDIK